MSDQASVLIKTSAGDLALTLPWSTTVGQLLVQAQAHAGAEDCELACADGVTMMNKLERTLQELRDRRLCPKREFVLREAPR